MSGVNFNDTTIKAGRIDKQTIENSTLVSTTSNTYVDMTGVTLTTKDLGETGDYTIVFDPAFSATLAANIAIRVVVDGVAITTSERDIDVNPVSSSILVTSTRAQIAANKVVKIQWKTSAGTASLTGKFFEINGVPVSHIL